MQNAQKTCLRRQYIHWKKKKIVFCFNMKVENTNWSVLVTTDTLQLWMLLPATDASCPSLWHVWTPHVVLVYFSGSSCCIQSVILAIVNLRCPFFLPVEFGTHVTGSGVRGAYGIAATEEGFLGRMNARDFTSPGSFLFLTIVIFALLKWTCLSISRHLATATDGQECK